MLDDGLFERFGDRARVRTAPLLKYPTGVLGFREGPMYASSDSIEIDVLGVGGHGAAPHDAVDPIYTAASIRRLGAAGRVAADRSARTGGRDDRRNSRRHDSQRHPAHVPVLGTVRAFSRGRAQSDGRAHRARAARVLRAPRARATIHYIGRYPVTANDPEQTRYARALARRRRRRRARDRSREADGCRRLLLFRAARTGVFLHTRRAAAAPIRAIRTTRACSTSTKRALPTGVAMMTALALDAGRNAP